jgi:hypothetical protein
MRYTVTGFTLRILANSFTDKNSFAANRDVCFEDGAGKDCDELFALSSTTKDFLQTGHLTFLPMYFADTLNLDLQFEHTVLIQFTTPLNTFIDQMHYTLTLIINQLFYTS